ncbi:MAG: Crp/Fnr family transcriptional regulator [Synechococcaceae cyanobacterium]|nr:Crp/Fnr family transcriptional regulator [Synechococcaceae cyanobacterium]
MVYSPSREIPRPEGIRELLEASFQKRNIVHLGEGSSVPLLRQQVWLVVRGMVKLGAITIHGDEMVLGLAGPSEPFGEPFADVDAYEARTLCATDLLSFSLQEIEADPTLCGAMLRALAARHRQSQSLLALMSLRRVEERVRGFLELLVNEYGQPCPEGLRLDLRLTHQELASAVGTTRVTVTRVIGALREQGWLCFDERRRLIVTYLPQR